MSFTYYIMSPLLYFLQKFYLKCRRNVSLILSIILPRGEAFRSSMHELLKKFPVGHKTISRIITINPNFKLCNLQLLVYTTPPGKRELHSITNHNRVKHELLAPNLIFILLLSELKSFEFHCHVGKHRIQDKQIV